MNAVAIGPLMLSAEQASAFIGLVVFQIAVSVAARRIDGSLARWSSFGLLAGFAAARIGHVAIHWDTFAPEPHRIVMVWQGGFYWPAGAAAAVLLLLTMVGMAGARIAGLASLAAGLFVWQSALLLSSPVEPIPLPEQPLVALSGKSVPLSDFRGKPIVVNLWASWCPPCRREMPMMVDTAGASREAIFVFANQGESAPQVRSFLDEEGIAPPNVVLDGLGLLGRHYEAPGLPTTLFIDRGGRLVHAHVGEISREALMQKIQDLQRN